MENSEIKFKGLTSLMVDPRQYINITHTKTVKLILQKMKRWGQFVYLVNPRKQLLLYLPIILKIDLPAKFEHGMFSFSIFW